MRIHVVPNETVRHQLVRPGECNKLQDGGSKTAEGVSASAIVSHLKLTACHFPKGFSTPDSG